MKHRELPIALAVSSLILTACGDTSSPQATESVATPSRALSANPCELLNETLVREFMSIPQNVPIEQTDDSDARFPSCGYRWRVMSEAREQAAQESNNAKLRENLQAGKPPNEGINYNIPTHSKVRLTAVKFETSAKAQSALESARGFMENRAEQTGRGATTWDAVDGVGDAAYYHGTQLSFTAGDLLMHLDVTPVETATAVANDIIN